MDSNKKALTFRVTCIPVDIPTYDFAAFLLKVIPSLGTVDNIKTGSLAPSPDDFSHRPSRTATVLFLEVPPLFQNGSDRWSFPITGHAKDLVVDKHFIGFTALNDAGPYHDLE
jgi:hypothetical protein